MGVRAVTTPHHPLNPTPWLTVSHDPSAAVLTDGFKERNVSPLSKRAGARRVAWNARLMRLPALDGFPASPHRKTP